MGTSLESYAAWIQRAESFVRQLNYLPGTWGIVVDIEPPLSHAQVDEADRHFPFGLPAPLRRLYTEATAGCKLRYHWSPADEYLPRVQTVFEHDRSFYGGPEFAPWTALLQTREIIPTYLDLVPEEKTEEREILKCCVPFIHVGNGDLVALCVRDSDSMPVVYISHDAPEWPITTLSSSLDQFLADWEKLCYIGPEIWLLGAFLGNRREGPLSIEQDIVNRWRDVILTRPAV